MKGILVVLIIVLIAGFSYAQTMSERQQHLDELRKMIREEEERLQQTEAEKQDLEQNISTTQSQRQQIENRLQELQKSERDIRQRIDGIRDNMRSILQNLDYMESRSENLQNMCENQLFMLFMTHYSQMVYEKTSYDDIYLTLIVEDVAKQSKHTRTEIKRNLEEKLRLESLERTQIRQAESVQQTRSSAAREREEYTQRLTSLTISLSEVEERYQQALDRKEQLEQEARELDALISKLRSEIIETEYSYQFSTPKLIWPTTGEVVRGFGEHINTDYRISVMNNGIDIQVPEGSDVFAVDEGVVAFAETYGGAGKLIIIDHRNGYYSLYSHNSMLLVSKGDNVEQSQKIALSGKSGSADFPKLHFEIRRRGKPVDPMEYLE